MRGEELRLKGVELAKKRRYGEAYDMLNEAIAQGNVIALNDLGVVCERKGLHAEAFDCYMEGSKHGVATATRNAANLLLRGIGTSKDVIKAINMFQEAIKQGDIYAYHNLYEIFVFDKQFNNEKLGYKYLKKGAKKEQKRIAEQGCTVDLAYCYEVGEHFKQSKRRAFKTLLKGYGSEKEGVIYNLGLCYLYGKGTRKNEKKGLELLNDAANMDYGDAFYKIAAYYYENEDVSQYKTLVKHYIEGGIEHNNLKCLLLCADISLGKAFGDDEDYTLENGISALTIANTEIKKRGLSKNNPITKYYAKLIKKYKNKIDINEIENEEVNKNELC